VRNGVAIIAIDGPMAPKMNLMSALCGGVSMSVVGNSVMQAAADPDISGIVLAIDSPGGTVSGTQELMGKIRAANKVKPIVALAEGMMASAAYWVGSAASKVYASSGTDQIGSIGVVASHVDVSGQEAADGIKTTEITAGKYKRIASSYEPLTEEGRKSIQDQVDFLYSVFVNDVAGNRGVSVDVVKSDMADGRIFIGSQALKAGLIDGVKSMDEVISELSAGLASTKLDNITADGIKNDYPSVYSEIVKIGADAERARIMAVESKSLPGHEALIASMKFDGSTTGQMAAEAILDAEKAVLRSKFAAMSADAPSPVKIEANVVHNGIADDDYKGQWEASAALRHEYLDDFAAYSAYKRANKSGKVRILSNQ
jgi:signal peptide peptidase SppA